MTPLPGKPESLWVDTMPEIRLPALNGDITVDVAIVGGGIAGLTAAVLLKRAGRRVAVLEARRIGRQVTGHSTAKITSQHSLIYADLIRRVGKDGARLYAESNQAAIERIAAFIAERGIDCAFERTAAYTYTQSPDRVHAIEAEVEAACRLGLPATLVREAPLPYGIAAAVRFDDQAQFNPSRYLAALAAEVDGGDSFVYEDTRVEAIRDGSPCSVDAGGVTVTADDVIVATNLPVITKSEFHRKAKPRAHLVLAAPIAAADAPDGMFISIDEPTHSIRTAPHGDGRMLVVVGPGYPTGQVGDTARMYRELADFVRRTFGVGDITHRWGNEDYDSKDRIPFIGRAAKDSRHLYVATGFCSWGISNGTVASMILADTIGGRSNPWAGLYDATREPGEAAGSAGRPKHQRQDESAKPRGREAISALAPGEGGVFQIGDQKLGIYRDEQGNHHAVSAVCTHLGCTVTWNNGNRTWDCTCHGSCFERDGTVIHGPAVKALERKYVEKQYLHAPIGPT